MNDDIPDTAGSVLRRGCGCLLLMLVSSGVSLITLWNVFELARAIARYFLQ